MLYLFAGDDTKAKLDAYEEFLKTLPAQAGLPEEMPVFFVNKNDFDPAQIESFYSGASLFAAKSAVIFHDILDDEEAGEFVLGRFKFMSDSNNLFVFVEGKLKKTVLDTFRKARAELNIFERKLAPSRGGEKFDNFQVANAFAAKDKFHTWLYFRQAVEQGTELDALAGILFWKVKDMILRRNFSKWKDTELKNFARKIPMLLPKARRKGPEAESAFEQFLLEAF